MRSRISILFILGILLSLSLTLIKADVVSFRLQDYKQINIINNLTNINDFPDYMFFSFGFGPCRPQLIGSDGVIIERGYRYCTKTDVFAVKKIDFDNFNQTYNNMTYQDFNNKIGILLYNKSNSIKILHEIETIKTVSPTDPRYEIYKEYNINLKFMNNQPVKVVIRRDYLIYIYMIVPIISIIFVIIILKKRKIENMEAGK